MKACFTGSEHSARPTTSQSARFSAGRLRMYSGNRSILTRVCVPSVEIVALAAAVHRPVVARLRHQREHLRVDVVGKHVVEFEMEERLLDRLRAASIDCAINAAQALDRALAVVAGQVRSTGPCTANLQCDCREREFASIAPQGKAAMSQASRFQAPHGRR